MNGCQTCGGFGDRHDPIAHGTEPKMDEQPWMDAGREALWAWESFRRARTPLEWASAIDALNNHMQDLVTFLPDYDERTGWLPYEDES